MTGLKLDVAGASALATSSEAASDYIEDAVDEALVEYGALWLGAAVRAAPRLTGATAASHSVTAADGRVTVTASTPWAAYVHAHNPWLARAAHNTAPDAVAHVEQALTDAVQKIRGA